MRFLSRSCSLLIWFIAYCFLLLPFFMTTAAEEAVAAATTADDPSSSLEDELVQETIAEGRGDRDERGVRDQWESTEHLKRKENVRVLSSRVEGLLHRYRLQCEGCTEQQAVRTINAFLQEAKKKAKEETARKSWLQVAAGWVTLLVAVAAGAFVYYRDAMNYSRDGSVGGLTKGRRQDLDNQRRLYAKKKEEALRMASSTKTPPTWRENEEREVWSDEQEDQFARALRSFGGVPPKARYILIAEKVDGKDRQECLLHHKLLQLMEEEKREMQRQDESTEKEE